MAELVYYDVGNGTSKSILDILNAIYAAVDSYALDTSGIFEEVIFYGFDSDGNYSPLVVLSSDSFTGSPPSGRVTFVSLFDPLSPGCPIAINLDETDIFSGFFYRLLEDDFSAAFLAGVLLDYSDDTFAGDTADQIIDFKGNDFIQCGGGDDFAFGGDGIDHILGGDGFDALSGGNDDDVLNGGAASDTLDGGADDDTLLGAGGDDDLNGGVGADLVVGSAGFDTAVFNAQSRVNLSNPASSGGEAKGDEYFSIERFRFDGGNDAFVGDDGAQGVLGGSGNDTLSGGGGIDLLQGEAGNDRLTGGLGNDGLKGNEGNDTLSDDTGLDIIDGAQGRDVAILSAGAVRISLPNQNLNAGNAAGDRFFGIEVFELGNGNDAFTGAARAERVFGNGGNDTLNGGGGNDTLGGGPGGDRLSGATGADRFEFAGQPGVDVVTDFTSGQDKIGVSQSGYGFTTFRLVVNAGPATSQGTFLFNTSNDHLSYDGDGNGTGSAILVATLSGIATLLSTDFTILA